MISKLVSYNRRIRRPLRDFIKSSFLSLLVIGLILLTLFKMDQAYTMMVFMLEEDKVSLFLCFFFINALALTLSHYPIYTFYSKGLNNSKGAVTWNDQRVETTLFKKIKISYPFFIYKINKKNYTPSVTANILRYVLGVFMYAVWVIFIYKSVRPNLLFNELVLMDIEYIAWIVGVFFSFPLIIYSIIKYRIDKNRVVNKTVLYTRITQYYFIAILLSILLLTYIIISDSIFSRVGFVIVMSCTYAMMFCYVFFKLIRSRLTDVYNHLDPNNKLRWFIKIISYFENPFNYLKLFVVIFIISICCIIYWNIAALYGYNLIGNVIPILLVYLYAYYWIIANVGKYFYVASTSLIVNSNSKKRYFDTLTYKIGVLAITSILLLAIGSFFFAEQETHEIERVSNIIDPNKIIDEDQFVESLKQIKEDRLFFISSYGGGLKANAWTLNVLQKIQEETDHKFLNQTISLSGASGGSLGLAVYTGLYAQYGTQNELLREKIDAISRENYASADLALTLGIDLYRKLWPLTYKMSIKDRSYYSMIKYQNYIEDTPNKNSLNNSAYREYWAKAFNNNKTGNGYFPSLIMNTASIRASRGILWSVKNKTPFNSIFPSADNLADLYKDKSETLPYYQAVSMTNRFPGLSPAAKIKGYGHYMDAGVIDNSGLLSNMDVYNYLKDKDSLFANKEVVFVDIINSKDLYIDHLMKKFIKGGFDDRAIDELEKDNVIVNLETALNYNKIPKYLSDFFTNWDKKKDDKTGVSQGKIQYLPIYLPHKITVKDIEKYMYGAYEEQHREELSQLLKPYNDKILSKTKTDSVGFFSKWDYYEPTLSRHMGASSYNYMKEMLTDNEYINQVINKVNTSTSN